MRSGSGGPCNHCGRTASPCWRKGPWEKPLLCNACGARWLTKKSLVGYRPHPQHAPRGAAAVVQKGVSAPVRKKQRASARYDVEDLYHGGYRGDSAQLALQVQDPLQHAAKPTLSSNSSASSYTKQQTDERSTLESAKPVGHPASAGPMRQFVTSGGAVTTVVRRPRKQPHPVACAVS